MEHVLKTDRCYIRQLQKGDIEAEIRLLSDPEMLDFVEPPEEYDEEIRLWSEYKEKVYDRYGYGMMGIFDKDTDELIGEAGLEPRFDINRNEYPYDWMFEKNSAELGYFIKKELWGQGLCTEACKRIISYCNGNCGISCVFARTDDENTASVKVLDKLGFKKINGCIYRLDI